MPIILRKGPDRAWPLESAEQQHDGTWSQRYRTSSGSEIVRRTCAARDRATRKYPVWWEVEVEGRS